jgi:hypothetical protein
LIAVANIAFQVVSVFRHSLLRSLFERLGVGSPDFERQYHLFKKKKKLL